MKDCQFGVSPVNYSDSDSDYPHGSRIIQPRIPPISVHPVNGTGFYVVHFGLLRIVRGQAKILVVVTFERHLAYLRTMKLAQYTYHMKGEEMFF